MNAKQIIFLLFCNVAANLNLYSNNRYIISGGSKADQINYVTTLANTLNATLININVNQLMNNKFKLDINQLAKERVVIFLSELEALPQNNLKRNINSDCPALKILETETDDNCFIVLAVKDKNLINPELINRFEKNIIMLPGKNSLLKTVNSILSIVTKISFNAYLILKIYNHFAKTNIQKNNIVTQPDLSKKIWQKKTL